MAFTYSRDWDRAASCYSAIQDSSYYSGFNREFVKSQIRDIEGLNILDAGCGDGYFADYFRNRGAKVTGCDGSAEMIKLAEASYPDIQFDLVNLLDNLPYTDKQFDMVFCNQVLMDLENIDNVISEISRFYLGDWQMDDEGRKLYKKVADYLSIRPEKNYFWGPTMHYHRPLSYYMNISCKNKLMLQRMYEPAIPLKNGDDSTLRIPLFLFAKLKKTN